MVNGFLSRVVRIDARAKVCTAFTDTGRINHAKDNPYPEVTHVATLFQCAPYLVFIEKSSLY
jgi:hypothetical protein